MKQLFTVITILTIASAKAQIPSGYYNSATGTGYSLKTQLHNIIDNQNNQGYNAMDGFFSSYDKDNYYESGSNTILDVYTENPSGSDTHNFTPVVDECGQYSAEGDCYNKEHVIPKSVFNEANPMNGDAHNLLPTDGRINGFRAAYPYGRVNTNDLVSQSGISNPTSNGSMVGGNLNSGYSAGYSGIVFEPIDEFKGDIARIYFYFVTRYEDQITNWNSFPMFDGSRNKALETTFLNILLQWHNDDPVSQKEIDRNNNIYYNHQNNRNPFIDHPEYVAAIWNPEADTEAPTAPTNLVATTITSNSIDLNWDASSDNVGVQSYVVFKDGTIEATTSDTNYSVTGLTPVTNYCFTVVAKDAMNNSSPESDELCQTTSESGTGSENDLFFSEYIEGSGTNKALEIANFTGETVDLSNYTIKLSYNGNPGWSSAFSFQSNAQIPNEDVYVIRNGGSTICTAVADYANNSMTGFNGNDAIGLFKNDVLIDIIGTLGNGDDYAKNTTLVRQQTVAGPSTSFNLDEWDSYSQNTCDNLGSHTQTLGETSKAQYSIKIYPNPVKGAFLFIDVKYPTTVECYNLTGQRILKTTVSPQNTVVDMSQLNSGVYLLQLQNDRHTTTRKIVRL